ncbi:hypothetical protein [Embleya sp. NPDC005971]|uniref:hypothetical protein n=1 Tax=Embleya sp. NPDC005971 TaxID=3156724 RepID=UPI0033FDD7C8
MQVAAGAVAHARRILDEREEAVRAAVDNLGGPEHLTPPGQPRNATPPPALEPVDPGGTTAPAVPRGPSRRTVLIRGAAALTATTGALVTMRGDGIDSPRTPENWNIQRNIQRNILNSVVFSPGSELLACVDIGVGANASIDLNAGGGLW